jgi:hypothetical protein
MLEFEVHPSRCCQSSQNTIGYSHARKSGSVADSIHQTFRSAPPFQVGPTLAADPKAESGIGMRLYSGLSPRWLWEIHPFKHLVRPAGFPFRLAINRR